MLGKRAFRRSFFHLLIDALGRERAELVLQRATLGARLLRDGERKARGLLARAEDAQGIFVEGVRDMPQDAALQVAYAAVRVEELTGDHVPAERVHGEVAAQRGVREGHLRVALDDEPAVTATGFGLAARQSDVEHLAVLPQVDVDLEDTEGAADRVHRADVCEDALEGLEIELVDLEVEIFGDDAQEVISTCPTDDDRAAARGDDRVACARCGGRNGEGLTKL